MNEHERKKRMVIVSTAVCFVAVLALWATVGQLFGVPHQANTKNFISDLAAAAVANGRPGLEKTQQNLENAFTSPAAQALTNSLIGTTTPTSTIK